jgi:hypothetical protein
MTALAKYDAACRAVAECKSVVEAKDMHDKAAAMEFYARAAKNKELEADAKAIRMRAVRKLGQLMKAQKEGVGLAKGGGGKHGRKRVSEKPTLESQGIDKNMAQKGRELGAMPEEKFQQALEDVREAVKAPKPKSKSRSKSAPAPSTRLLDAWHAATPEERPAFVNKIGLTNLYVLASPAQKKILADTVSNMVKKANGPAAHAGAAG